jgi:predicted adenylyl cyclase CyaB
MPTNIELKARVRNPPEQCRVVEGLTDAPAELVEQVDTFFFVPRGRLKLRQSSPGRAELIFYERSDQLPAKRSEYTRIPTDQPEELRHMLARALGVRGVVRKKRRLYLVGQTRIHWDEVDGLGEFLELEVVLRPDQSAEDGGRIVGVLRHQLGIRDDDLIAGAYIDLIEGECPFSCGVVRPRT